MGKSKESIWKTQRYRAWNNDRRRANEQLEKLKKELKFVDGKRNTLIARIAFLETHPVLLKDY